MSDQRIIELLEEIRDIGTQNAENYKLALAARKRRSNSRRELLAARTTLMAIG